MAAFNVGRRSMSVQPAHEDFRTGIRLNPLKEVAAFVRHPVDGDRTFHRLHGNSPAFPVSRLGSGGGEVMIGGDSS